LAWRLPERFTRWRTVLPEDASIGEMTDKATKGCLAAQAFWVVAHRGEQDGSYIGANPIGTFKGPGWPGQ
jgi:hypothetical protein